MPEQEKKIMELNVLCDFQRSVAQKYKFETVSEEEAKDIFPNYNNENPDFVIKYENTYKGVELTELISSSNTDIKEKTGRKNLSHYYNTKKQGKFSKYLFKSDDLYSTFIEAYQRKLVKRKNYVTPKTWFLAYATQPFNRHLIKYAQEDNILELLKTSIETALNNDNSFEKIFVYTSFQDFIWQIR